MPRVYQKSGLEMRISKHVISTQMAVKAMKADEITRVSMCKG